MSENLKRYNQGLWKFGPMEQCNDGEWVRYNQADELINTLHKNYESVSDDFLDLRVLNNELESEIVNIQRSYYDLVNRHEYLRRLSAGMAFMFGMLSVYIMFGPL